MAQKIIDLGTSPNKGDGDPLRTAFTKINDNFSELYTGSPIVPQDLRGSVFGDDSTLLVDGVNSSIPKANIEDSTNWDTAFGWGDHSTAGYADGTNEANWNTAFGWGNHSTAGYLTSYTVTESDVTTHQTALSITESQITDLAHYDDTALATRVSTLENAGYITSETDSQELTLVGTDLSISSGNTVDLSGFLTSVPAQTFASLTGTPTTLAGYGITDAIVSGAAYDGDITGSVFGDDSTLLVDAVNNKIVGPVDTASVDAVSLRTSATSIALGYEAGNTGQGANAIAIGEKAGYANQAANSIVINATGTEVYNFGASSLVITPIRNDTMVTILGYDADTGQVTHNAAIPGYTNTADLKALVAASTDFADFQTRIAAL